MSKKVIICGGGASGFFAAINIAKKNPNWEISILEKSRHVLSKVKISGGGRCNVTNARTEPSELVPFYPRGGKKLYQLFKAFSTKDTVSWFARRGVKIVDEPDLRMFPVTNTSETIIACFMSEMKKYKVKLHLGVGLTKINKKQNGWSVMTSDDQEFIGDYLVIATGSSSLVWNELTRHGYSIVPPVPSLFTFNIKDSRLKELMGTSFPHVGVKITGTKFSETGPLLITHWGLSGPAILKLSALAARELADKQYMFSVLINFSGSKTTDDIRNAVIQLISGHPKKKVINQSVDFVPKRYWERILTIANIDPNTPISELSKKSINKLTEELSQAKFDVCGKSTFKEEFVTAGGVQLSDIDLSTMESRLHKGLFFTGEVVNIDALTGGFNFQACWSTAWILSQAMGEY